MEFATAKLVFIAGEQRRDVARRKQYSLIGARVKVVLA